MQVQIEKINKEKALEYLKANTKNRPQIRANIDFVKEELLNNRFLFNGQSITFDWNGVLQDGQHRLLAISELDVEVEILVVRGVSPEAFKTIDTGAKRTAKDVLGINKVPYAVALSSAINRILGKFDQSRKVGKSGSVKFSNTEILDFYNQNKKELDDNASFIHTLYNSETKIITPALGIAMLFLLKKENPNKAKSFIREIYTGTKEGEDISALTLRKRLLNLKIEGFKINSTMYRNLFVSAFRAYCQNRNLTKIQISNNQFFKEDY